HNLWRLWRGRCWERPRISRKSSGRAGVECSSLLIGDLNVRSKAVAKKTRPRRFEVARWFRQAKSFLDQLGSLHFGPTKQHVHESDFSEPAKKRQNHRLD